MWGASLPSIHFAFVCDPALKQLHWYLVWRPLETWYRGWYSTKDVPGVVDRLRLYPLHPPSAVPGSDVPQVSRLDVYQLRTLRDHVCCARHLPLRSGRAEEALGSGMDGADGLLEHRRRRGLHFSGRSPPPVQMTVADAVLTMTSCRNGGSHTGKPQGPWRARSCSTALHATSTNDKHYTPGRCTHAVDCRKAMRPGAIVIFECTGMDFIRCRRCSMRLHLSFVANRLAKGSVEPKILANDRLRSWLKFSCPGRGLVAKSLSASIDYTTVKIQYTVVRRMNRALRMSPFSPYIPMSAAGILALRDRQGMTSTRVERKGAHDHGVSSSRREDRRGNVGFEGGMKVGIMLIISASAGAHLARRRGKRAATHCLIVDGSGVDEIARRITVPEAAI
nr:hypothetical protein CFP56_00592 [Quercus suber]